MNKNSLTVFCLILVFSTHCKSQVTSERISNPIMEGYFADPTIIKQGKSFYIYATIDPWGGDELAVFETVDFKKFKRHHLTWPTKKLCTSSTSGGAMVWAPSVVKAPNGKFYMYVSVGSEVWAGISEHPLGPWRNAKVDNTPLITANANPGVHAIDADCFIDTDGQPYLYWGSGLNWVNGHCLAVKLKPDMITFNGIPRDITPPNYFEAPHMLKYKGNYYLMYSNGKAIDATYNIRYSVSSSPFGPWKEGLNSPILSTSADSTIIGPGHHTIFQERDQLYILYHKIFPQKKDIVLRQLCLDSLQIDSYENVKKVKSVGIKAFN